MRYLDTLRRLAGRASSPWPTLSVYVNTRPVGPQMSTYRPFLKKRIVSELQQFAARSPERESLEVDYARVQHYLDYDLRESTQAAAVFACYAGDDLFDAVQLPVEFPDHLVSVGRMPTLYPLLRMADRANRVGVAVADEEATRLYVLAFDSIDARREVRAPAAGRAGSEAGRTGELATQSARVLEELARNLGVEWLLVGGEPVAADALRRALAPEAAARLLEAGEWSPRIPEADLAADVSSRVVARETEDRVRLATALVAAATAGTAGLGLEAALSSLREDRAAALFLGDAFPAGAAGWGCRSCRSFDPGPAPPTCPACGRDSTEAVALREELGAQALARDVAVRFVPAGAVPEFDSAGAIGATRR